MFYDGRLRFERPMPPDELATMVAWLQMGADSNAPKGPSPRSDLG